MLLDLVRMKIDIHSFNWYIQEKLINLQNNT